MALNKSEIFEQNDIKIALICKALSHPARVKILKILTELNVCMCGDIVNLIPLSQSTVSQHLKELKNAGLIKGAIDGPKVCYCADKQKIRDSFQIINEFQNQLIDSQGGCKNGKC
ncbi:MAG: metalloregulator ArsR/SmtB family transcription factor [Melioribacteraceae bacterium]|nr:metalloregulator ArsR/SmtB family transcription factor [Melioribacteraceae bacterium]